MSTEKNNRDFINFIRGFAIFLMLWGHCIQCCCAEQFDFFNNTIFKIIYSFHMPLFMLISGYLFFFSAKKRNLVELIEYKGKSLLYPIFMCSVLNLLLTYGVRLLFGKHNNLLGGVSVNELWFLWSVLACSIAVSAAAKTTNKIIKMVLLLLGIVVAAIMPWWEMNVYMYPYFVIGYLYANIIESKGDNKIKKPLLMLISLLCTAAFIILLTMYEKKHYIYTTGLLGGENTIDSIEIDIFRYAIGLFGSVTAILFCKIIMILLKYKKIVSGIETLGRNSLAIYGLSVSLLSFWLPKIADSVLKLFNEPNLNNYIWIYNLIVTPLIAIAYSVLLLFIVKLMKKTGIYRLIFGR